MSELFAGCFLCFFHTIFFRKTSVHFCTDVSGAVVLPMRRAAAVACIFSPFPGKFSGDVDCNSKLVWISNQVAESSGSVLFDRIYESYFFTLLSKKSAKY